MSKCSNKCSIAALTVSFASEYDLGKFVKSLRRSNPSELTIRSCQASVKAEAQSESKSEIADRSNAKSITCLEVSSSLRVRSSSEVSSLGTSGSAASEPTLKMTLDTF